MSRRAVCGRYYVWHAFGGMCDTILADGDDLLRSFLRYDSSKISSAYWVARGAHQLRVHHNYRMCAIGQPALEFTGGVGGEVDCLCNALVHRHAIVLAAIYRVAHCAHDADPDNAANANARAGKGDVAVELATGREDGLVLVEVLDRGPGLDPARVEAARHAPLGGHAEGMGVGLMLAHAAIEHHGGRLEFRSRSGGGTIARMLIPEQVAR